MLKWPKLPAGAHVRTCQECGHAQAMKSPAEQQTDNWRGAKCRRCKSEALDYGSTNREEIDEEIDED